jgi:hypothetical protein
MPEPKLLKLSEKRFWRHAAVQPDTLAAAERGMLSRKVPEVPWMRVFESKAAVVLLAHVPRAIEPKEEAALAVSMSEAARL